VGEYGTEESAKASGRLPQLVALLLVASCAAVVMMAWNNAGSIAKGPSNIEDDKGVRWVSLDMP